MYHEPELSTLSVPVSSAPVPRVFSYGDLKLEPH